MDKETKRQIDQEFSEGWYVTKKILGKCLIVLVSAGVVLGGIGIAGRFIGTNANRAIFKQSITYNEGILDDLAKYKYEYDSAEDDVEKNAIASLVRNRFANYDKSKIENRELVEFLRECGV